MSTEPEAVGFLSRHSPLQSEQTLARAPREHWKWASEGCNGVKCSGSKLYRVTTLEGVQISYNHHPAQPRASLLCDLPRKMPEPSRPAFSPTEVTDDNQTSSCNRFCFKKEPSKDMYSMCIKSKRALPVDKSLIVSMGKELD